MRIGFGFDTHALVSGRELILGGVCVPFCLGLLGHSDADVLVHAIIDSLFGALALGNIGEFFPDTSQEYRGVSSLELLKKAKKIINIKNYKISNIDSSIVLEKPKVSPYIPEMKKNISNILEVDINEVSVKAKTSEKLGFIGREEGVCAYAVVLLKQKFE